MLSINISELVLTIISFFILLFLLNRLLFTPVSRFMAERQARLDASLEKEREASGEVAANRQRVEEDKSASRDEAKTILANQRTEDGKKREEFVRRLTVENAGERRNAKARVDAMAKDARAQFDSEKDELVKTLAERLTD